VLLWQAAGNEALSKLREHPPSPSWFAAAFGAIVFGSVLSFLRWRCVARATGIEMSAAESVRLGALGFACNFVALGSVGGDVVKAALLAKSRPGQRAAAVTTVLVDRLLGLVGFLSYAAAAVLVTGAATAEAAPLRLLSQSTLVVTAIALTAFAAFFAPGRPVERVASWLEGLPFTATLGRRIGKLASRYRDGWRSLLAAAAVGLAMNGVFILSFYLAGAALPLKTPSVAQHFFAVPLALISGTLPISPNGLGTIEATAEYLYLAIDPASSVGAGTLASLTHRVAMLFAGLAAAAYYYAAGGRRSDVAEVTAMANRIVAPAGSGTELPGAPAASRQTV
jgi:uncharacterized protein (TIRG00374 family)